MRQMLITMVALAFMVVGMLLGNASADTTDSAAASAANTCPNRWVDPVYDCVQFENEEHNLACARLAAKINTMCGLQKPELQASAASDFDPLSQESP